jgi:hypothetical protein
MSAEPQKYSELIRLVDCESDRSHTLLVDQGFFGITTASRQKH